MADDTRDELEPNHRIDYGVPSAARTWNYWQGGKDNYQVDQQACEAALEIYDMNTMATQARQFLLRVVRYLAGEAGIRQFLDIGTGLPTTPNTHEIAQKIAPNSKIVYVDNDPIVLAHAQALMKPITAEGAVDYIDTDFHHPELILSKARTLIDFTQPVAVMFMGVLGFARDVQTATSIVARVMHPMPPGSYLAHWEANDTDPAFVTAAQYYEQTGAIPYIPQPVNAIRQRFDGMDMIEPGLVSITQWRPDTTTIGQVRPMAAATGGLARKPQS